MKIAVPYLDGNVNAHFGHTREMKIYEIRDGAVSGSEIITIEKGGHEAIADLLDGLDVAAVICDGLGANAQTALADRRIMVYSGVTGPADEAVDAFLQGELTENGATCRDGSYNESEASSQNQGGCGCGGSCGCGSSSEGGCGGGCGGSCGCGPRFEGKNVGKTVRTHYRGTFNDGTQFDSSYDRGEPLEFVCGAGMMILGFDKAVADMEPGEKKTVHLMPAEAYGESDPEAIFSVPIAEMPGAEDLVAGQTAYLRNMYGQPFRVLVAAKTEDTVTFDANHEMAGKELNFEIELVSVEE